MAVVERSEMRVASEGTRPVLGEPVPRYTLVVLGVMVAVPFLALLAAVPVAWGWGLSWRDVAIGLIPYLLSGLGITVGFNRYFTHGSFKAVRWLRIALAVAGSLAVEGEGIQWGADHRRHHAYAHREGDPHSPGRFGARATGLFRGRLFAHYGWLLPR